MMLSTGVLFGRVFLANPHRVKNNLRLRLVQLQKTGRLNNLFAPGAILTPQDIASQEDSHLNSVPTVFQQ